jgi:hypothetical protein
MYVIKKYKNTFSRMSTAQQTPLSTTQKRKLDQIADEDATVSGESSPPTLKKQKVEPISSDDSSSNAQRNSSDEMSVEETKAERRRRKRIDRRPASGTFVLFENLPMSAVSEIIEQIQDPDTQKEFPDAKMVVLDKDLLRLYPSKEQIKKERKDYRKHYNNTPENIAKLKEKAKRPEEIEKRKKNNEDESTKERKKKCAYARRKVLNSFKEQDPVTYERLFSQFAPAIPRKERRKLKRAETVPAEVVVQPF